MGGLKQHAEVLKEKPWLTRTAIHGAMVCVGI